MACSYRLGSLPLPHQHWRTVEILCRRGDKALADVLLAHGRQDAGGRTFRRPPRPTRIGAADTKADGHKVCSPGPSLPKYGRSACTCGTVGRTKTALPRIFKRSNRLILGCFLLMRGAEQSPLWIPRRAGWRRAEGGVGSAYVANEAVKTHARI